MSANRSAQVRRKSMLGTALLAFGITAAVVRPEAVRCGGRPGIPQEILFPTGFS